MGFFTNILKDMVIGHALNTLTDRNYKQATYQEAVQLILDEIFELSRLSLPATYETLQPTYGEAIVFKSPQQEKIAAFDEALAIISYELIFIREIYRNTQSKDIIPKLHKWFFKLIEEGERGAYAREEVETYLSYYEDYVNRDPAFKGMPFLSPDFDAQLQKVVRRLIKKLYNNAVTIDDRKLIGAEPLTLREFYKLAILKSGGRWEKIFNGYALSEN